MSSASHLLEPQGTFRNSRNIIPKRGEPISIEATNTARAGKGARVKIRKKNKRRGPTDREIMMEAARRSGVDESEISDAILYGVAQGWLRLEPKDGGLLIHTDNLPDEMEA